MLKPFATKLDETTIEKLDSLSKRTQIPKSRLCRQAIDLLAAHYDKVNQDLQLAERMRNRESPHVVQPAL